MTNSIVEIKGVDELVSMFKTMPDKLAKKALKPALREVGKEIQRQAKNNVARHRNTGLLIGSVRVTSLRDKPGYPIAVVIGVTKKSKFKEKLTAQRKKLGKKFPNYPLLIEHGFTRKGKHYPAQPWLRPALHAVQGRAPQIMRKFVTEFFAELKRGA